jgi:hypothetical protein
MTPEPRTSLLMRPPSVDNAHQPPGVTTTTRSQDIAPPTALAACLHRHTSAVFMNLVAQRGEQDAHIGRGLHVTFAELGARVGSASSRSGICSPTSGDILGLPRAGGEETHVALQSSEATRPCLKGDYLVGKPPHLDDGQPET